MKFQVSGELPREARKNQQGNSREGYAWAASTPTHDIYVVLCHQYNTLWFPFGFQCKKYGIKLIIDMNDSFICICEKKGRKSVFICIFGELLGGNMKQGLYAYLIRYILDLI